MATTKLLLNGATGYIGGTILTQLLHSSNPVIRDMSISILVRKPEQAALFADKNVTPILFAGFNDTELIRRTASSHDVVINAASSTDPSVAQALIRGLADGGSGRHFLHVSGVSSLGDYPIPSSTAEVSDREDVYGDLLRRESVEHYAQRATDLAVVQTGEQAGVKTSIVKAPLIYGRGTGLGGAKSFHIPLLIQGAVNAGQAEYIGEGAGEWDDIHVVDVAGLFELLLGKVVAGDELPHGKDGIYFATSFRQSWKDLAGRVGKVGYQLGFLKSPEPQSISLQEAAKKYTMGNGRLAEVGLASRAATKPDRAYDLGWCPAKGIDTFNQDIMEDFRNIFPGK